MRIIGGHDYYDSALAFGQDLDVIFVRPKEQDVKPSSTFALPIYATATKVNLIDPKVSMSWRSPFKAYRNKNEIPLSATANSCISFVPCIVWFAGKRYGGVNAKSIDGSINKFFWSLDSLKSFVNPLGFYFADQLPQALVKKKFKWRYESKDVKLSLSKHLTQRDATQDELNVLIQNKVSIATWCYETDYSENVWRINGDNLKSFEFQKVLSPYQAMQELSMWVGGVLPQAGNPMVQILDDKVKIHKAGFDKWSFRKVGKKGML